MPNSARIYLDNAATSWPKPEEVYDVTAHWQREIGASAGRSAYREAAQSERIVAATRQSIARLINADDAKRIIFSANGTDALNLAIHGILNPGDHVITSDVEHNSVLRPLSEQEVRHGISITRVSCDDQGIIHLDDIQSAIRRETQLIVLVHASNVTGAIQPVAEVGTLARQNGIMYLIDAAQTLGHLPVNVHELGADLVAGSGHKGLLGPLGTGILYIAPGVESRLHSIRQGGTGTQSDEDRQPESIPHKYEVGNMNVPAIAGLGAGVEFHFRRGLQRIRNHEMGLVDQFLREIETLDGVTVYGPRDLAKRVAVVSFTLAGFDPQEVASVLDTSYGLQIRSGFHCAPRMHKALGTFQSGGTVRVSPGTFTTEAHMDAMINAVAEISLQGRIQ